MSANQSSTKSTVKNSLSVADRLERKLAQIKAAERKKFLNENVVRLEKNGDFSYETVRTYRVPVGQASGLPETAVPGSGVISDDHSSIAHSAASELTPDSLASPLPAPADPVQNPANSNLLPNKLPQTPVSHEIGNLIVDSDNGVAVFCEAKHGAQPEAPHSLGSSDELAPTGQDLSPNAGISCHEAPTTGNQNDPDALTELLHRAVAASKVRRGRPASLDDQAKGQLTALLAVGMSMRQAAVVLGVSHTTVQKTLKADPSLAEEITAARFQAQLQPLACVIREARRSWKAATWLLKYLDGKIASHEETPDERRERQQRESDEFFARAGGRNVKTHRVQA